MNERDRLADLSEAVGDGYSQPCFLCRSVLGEHEVWCNRRTLLHGVTYVAKRDRFVHKQTAAMLDLEATPENEAAHVAAVAEARQVWDTMHAIELSLEEWRLGRMTSPDEADYVHDAEKVLGVTLDLAVVQEIADELFADAGETYTTVEDVARFVLRKVKEHGPQQPG